jgi:hypothetical protein
MRIAGVALLGVLLLLARAARAEDEDPTARAARLAQAKSEMERDEADFAQRVNAAIDRGAAWLAAQQHNDGSYPGFSEDLKPRAYDIMEGGLNALVALTLSHCGMARDHDAVKGGMQAAMHYHGLVRKNGKLTVYVASTMILALDAMYRPQDKRRRKPAAVPKPDRYGNPLPAKVPKRPPCKYPSAARNLIKQLVHFIASSQTASGGWRYPGNPLSAPDGDTDLSNTQYALLALDAASRCGVEAPWATWAKAATYVLDSQEKDGLDTPVWIENEAWEPGSDLSRFLDVTQTQARGWAYIPGSMELSTGSMTAAGVTCLALCKERLWVRKKLDPELGKRIDRGILYGIGWLSENFSVVENPTPGGASMWHYYFLYGLERAGVKLGTRWIGRHDWYREGGEHLLAAQAPHGGWAEATSGDKPADKTESAITQTCFALLFLERSTQEPVVPMMPPVVTGEGGAPKDGR